MWPRRRALLIGLVLMVIFASKPALADGRVALIIGNSAYKDLKVLSNPGSDATRLTNILLESGFDVVSCDGTRLGCLDVTEVGLTKALETFNSKAKGAELAFFFYAGHGMEIGGVNVLAPIDSK